jgi:hypothetical protein
MPAERRDRPEPSAAAPRPRRVGQEERREDQVFTRMSLSAPSVSPAASQSLGPGASCA